MEGAVQEVLDLLANYGKSVKLYFRNYIPWLNTVILSLFTLINSLRILAYIPQILKAAKDKNGASAISYMTWGLFLISHLTTIAYALVILGDLLMALIFLGNAIACVAILGITFLKRRWHAAVIGHASAVGRGGD